MKELTYTYTLSARTNGELTLPSMAIEVINLDNKRENSFYHTHTHRLLVRPPVKKYAALKTAGFIFSGLLILLAIYWLTGYIKRQNNYRG